MLTIPFEVQVGEDKTLPRARLAIGGTVGTPVSDLVPPAAGDASLTLPALLSWSVQQGSPARLLPANEPARWIPVIDLAEAQNLDPEGFFLDHTGATNIATGEVHALRRLPRVLTHPKSKIADNTDESTSMSVLLEDFTQKFQTAQKGSPYKHVRVATGYLYAGGMARILRLLEIEGLQTIRLLFSGETDARTAKALAAALGEAVDELSPVGWEKLSAAVQSGKLDVRAYGDAFLHAKLYLADDDAWEDEDRGGNAVGAIGVVGSSNVSSSGLAAGGNLELDLTVRDEAVLTSLIHWFDGRWDEAYPPDPALLTVLEQRRPPPPPAFHVPGVAEVYTAGTDGALVPPERHLALLHGRYADRYASLPPAAAALLPTPPSRNVRVAPEQVEGARNLVARLLSVRVAFLADSVGLGKTLTALAAAWMMKQAGEASDVALVAPSKLWKQWEGDANTFGIPWATVRTVNRHILERDEPEAARSRLNGADLIIVEEAHEALRSRTNRLWINLRAYLSAHPDCRLLLVSATPWNNRREDIFNYLLLGWRDGLGLADRYTGLRDLSPELQRFGHAPPAQGARWFDELGVDTGYRKLFDATFVQRTRSMLERHYNKTPFPRRIPLALVTPPSATHDQLLASLASDIGELCLPYREPMRSLMRAATPEAAPGLGNFQKGLLLGLFKRAESSTYALAVSMTNTAAQLRRFDAELSQLVNASAPREALTAWIRARGAAEGEEDEELAGLTTSEQGYAKQVLDALDKRDDEFARGMLRKLREEQVAPDVARVDAMRARVSFDTDLNSPKERLLYQRALTAYKSGHKPILVAAYADTAARMFLRLIAQLPDARIGLALGGEEGWVSVPTQHARTDVFPTEWSASLGMKPAQRRYHLFRGESTRAEPAPRTTVLGRFAPRAQLKEVPPESQLDILVGSEAISVGQNLQDSTCLIQLDLPWNPMVIEQRIGRVDRRGGGRPDPENPGGQPIVDVIYCWSSDAVESAVKLRSKLLSKATGALADTRFDELLLDELHAQVMAKREINGGTLLEIQAQAAQRAGGGAGVGSDVDGIRMLAAWAKGREVSDSPPVVAAGGRGAKGWVVTVEGTALGPQGQKLGTILRSFGTDTDAPLLAAPDLELAVRRLTSLEARAATGAGRRAWTSACLALDAAIQAWGERTRETHNAEVDARDSAHLGGSTPNDQDRALLGSVLGLIRQLGPTLRKEPVLAALLQANKDRLQFVMEEVLAPSRVHALFSHGEEEARVRAALHAIKKHPREFLTQRFDELFDDLCGARWAARQSASDPQVPLPAAGLDDRWAKLSIRLLAATWCKP